MISDNDLLLYHYGDGLDVPERERIREALAAQPLLAARLQTLVNQLDAAAKTADVPVPMTVQQRWQDALQVAASAEARRARMIRPLQWGAVALACLALIAVVIVNTRNVEDASPQVAQVTPSSGQSRSDHGLQWHLASTEQQLIEISSASAADRARLVQVVLEQNRLFAAAAERAGDARLARALRSFAPILQNLAETQAADAAPGDLAQLSFELRVMQARLAADAPAASEAPAVTL